MQYEQWLERHPPTPFDPLRVYRPPEWLIEPLWLSGGKINGLFGTPKAGKSRFLAWALVAMLSGKPPLPGFSVGRQVERVLYLRGEESEEEIVHRLKQYAKLQHTSTATWDQRLTFMPAMNMMLELQRPRDYLKRTILNVGADLVVADPYIRLHGADENDAQTMGRIHNELRSWTDSIGFDLLLIHHTGKLEEGMPSDLDISRWARGTSDIAAILDTATMLHRHAKGVVMLRAGRFAPQPRLTLIDGGDIDGWGIRDG